MCIIMGIARRRARRIAIGAALAAALAGPAGKPAMAAGQEGLEGKLTKIFSDAVERVEAAGIDMSGAGAMDGASIGIALKAMGIDKELTVRTVAEMAGEFGGTGTRWEEARASGSMSALRPLTIVYDLDGEEGPRAALYLGDIRLPWQAEGAPCLLERESSGDGAGSIRFADGERMGEVLAAYDGAVDPLFRDQKEKAAGAIEGARAAAAQAAGALEGAAGAAAQAAGAMGAAGKAADMASALAGQLAVAGQAGQ